MKTYRIEYTNLAGNRTSAHIKAMALCMAVKKLKARECVLAVSKIEAF